jgi:hypothetical protein
VDNKDINNILLVEGESDIKFFEALIKYVSKTNASLNLANIKIDTINGSDNRLLRLAIKSLETDIKNSPIKNFGIIMDLDEYSSEDRFAQVKTVLTELFGIENLVEIDANNFNLKINDKKTIKVTCHFIENDLVTNLELLLKAIATENPIAANCLELWFNCATAAGRKIRTSDYLKLWREIYIRYDYCSNPKLLKHASENCTTGKSFDNLFIEGKPQAWDFENTVLDDLKNYLSTFSDP